MFIALLHTIVKNWKQFMHPLSGEGVSKLGSILKMERGSVTKRNDLLMNHK
jgi:hypothetical protein